MSSPALPPAAGALRAAPLRVRTAAAGRTRRRTRPLAGALLAGLVGLSAGAPAQEPAPPAPPAPLEARVDAAIERGVGYLRGLQRTDGSFDGPLADRPGQTALVLYALLASGVEADDPLVRAAVGELARRPATQTYDVACVLLALTARDPHEHRAWIEELARLLADWQRPKGDWAYPHGSADLSNTQFAALGLRAAALVGVEVPDEVWERMAEAVLDYGRPDGAFAYARGGGGTASMTAAGVGTLAICDERLSDVGALGARLATRLRKRRERALDWLAEQGEALLRASFGASYYTLYGVERVGALEDLELIGGRDWYRVGAADLCDVQVPEGGWGETGRPGGDVLSTSFALLFLRRATRASAVTGAVRTQRAAVLAVDDPDADVRFVANGSDPTALWITGFGAHARARFEWPGEEGRGPRVVRVAYLAEELVLAEVEGDASGPAGHERFATQVRLPAAGTYRLRARVVVMRPPHVTESGRELPSTPVVLVSPELTFVVEGLEPPWLAAERSLAGLNLLAGARPRVEASSTVDRDGFLASPPEHAVDGRVRTSWLAAPDDREPRLVIRLPRAVRADRLFVLNARAIPYRRGHYTRAAQVLARVNDGPPQVVLMGPDERVRGELVFPERTAVRKLDLRLRWPVEGEHPSLGLCEVELVRDGG